MTNQSVSGMDVDLVDDEEEWWQIREEPDENVGLFLPWEDVPILETQ